MKFLRQVELADVLLVVGIVLFLGGIAHFSGAIAAIVGGMLCFAAVWMMERAAAVAGKVLDGSAHK